MLGLGFTFDREEVEAGVIASVEVLAVGAMITEEA
jgi:hypothetical protein